jgi:hypothetical protein
MYTNSAVHLFESDIEMTMPKALFVPITTNGTKPVVKSMTRKQRGRPETWH